MNFSKLSIQKPVLTVMLNLVLIVFGFISYQQLSVSRLPNVEFPAVSIVTTYLGGDPKTIDSSITSPLETAVHGVTGLKRIVSSSTPNLSVISLQFNLNKNLDAAFNEVQAKVNQFLPNLPKGVDTPVVYKVQLDNDPIIFIAVTGDRPLVELTQFAETNIKKRLETIDGIGSTNIYGAQKRTIRIELDLNRLAAFNITTEDVMHAFSQEYVQIAGGFILNKTTEHLINLDLEFHSPEKLGELIVAYRDNLAIKLRDVATVIDGINPPRKLATSDNKPAVILGFTRSSGGNTVAIIEEIRKRLNNEIIPTLPAGIQVTVPLDDSTIIEQMVDELYKHIWLGTLLASVVVWIFLRNLISTLIVAVTIPISLFGALFSMYLTGYTINITTLLSLLLLIGIVVDDAIVIVENVYHHLERNEITGHTHVNTADATEQVMFAVVASTVTIVAIFAPVIFMGGIIGRFFESFAVVVTVGVLISLFVAITLTPMLCARFLRVSHTKYEFYERIEKFLSYIDAEYQKVLVNALASPKKILGIVFAICLICMSFSVLIGTEFLPTDDESRFRIDFSTPDGSNIDYTRQKAEEIERLVLKQPGVKNVFSYIDSFGDSFTNEGRIYVRLLPENKRSDKQITIINNLQRAFSNLSGVQAVASAIPVVTTGFRPEPLSFAIQGPDYDRINELAIQLKETLSKNPEYGLIYLDAKTNLPEYILIIDRLRAQSLGISAEEIGQTIAVLGGGYDIANYSDQKGGGERYKIRLASKAGQVTQPIDLSQIYLRNSTNGQAVRLDTVARLEASSIPGQINRADLQYATSLYVTPKKSLGRAMQITTEEANKVLPLGYQMVFQGQADSFTETTTVIESTLILALILVYMVLASQFNSFIQPFIIMMAQPLAIVGALVALVLTHTTINIFSMIGFVLLMGLVSKNSILLIDLANQKRKIYGGNINIALLDACPQRLRPILMTSLTVILAMLPSAFGTGAGANGYSSLAIAVIGGMISSTLLTLIVVPCTYSLVEYKLEEWRNKKVKAEFKPKPAQPT
jgi:HAE1 family hydrophobic/amphiphilic exporter-1